MRKLKTYFVRFSKMHILSHVHTARIWADLKCFVGPSTSTRSRYVLTLIHSKLLIPMVLPKISDIIVYNQTCEVHFGPLTLTFFSLSWSQRHGLGYVRAEHSQHVGKAYDLFSFATLCQNSAAGQTKELGMCVPAHSLSHEHLHYFKACISTFLSSRLTSIQLTFCPLCG